MRCVVTALLTCLTWLMNAARMNAAVGIGPFFEPSAVPSDVVGLRYSTRIDSIKPGKNVVILFGGMAFHHPGQQQIHRIEANIYNYWVAYKDTGSVVWPPGRNGIAHHDQGALWVSVPDYTREGFVGMRHRSQATFDLFPRMNSGIDNTPGITKIETISQQNMVGKDIYVEITKGGVEQFDSPQQGWGGRYRLDNNKQVSAEELPGGTYQVWKVRVAFDGVEYGWEAVFPADQAKYFAPHQIIHFVTEFFEMESRICAYVWNPQILREGETKWDNLARWNYHYQAGPDPYGPRITVVDNRHVLEMSNDKEPESYFKKDAIFELTMNPVVQWQSAESRPSKEQEVVRINAVMERPAPQPVELRVRATGTAVRGVDYTLDETVAFYIPAGKMAADLDIPLGRGSSREAGKTITLTFITASPAAMAGRITHVVTLASGA